MAQTIYTNCSTITTGCFLYTDAGLTTPAGNGKYSNGINCYTVTGGAGEVTSTVPCQPVAEITVYGLNNGAGSIIFRADVTAGTTLNNLTFDGEVTRYSNGGCITQSGTECPFTGLVLVAGDTSEATGALCSSSGILSTKVLALTVNGITITSSPQTITVSGNDYVIKGFGVCTAV